MNQKRVSLSSLLTLLVFASRGAPALAASAEVSCDDYYFGIGRTPDFSKALACESAAPHPNWGLIAVMYLNGEGAPRDAKRAREALQHMDPAQSGITYSLLEAKVQQHEAHPSKKYPRIDYCQEIAQTTLDGQYCEGIEVRKSEARQRKEATALASDLSPVARKALQALTKAFASFKEADGNREYTNFADGSIRGEAGLIMQQRVARHYDLALAAWGPKADRPAAAGRSLPEADKELNEIYGRIVGKSQNALAVSDATRKAQRAWLHYAKAWKELVAALHPEEGDNLPALLDALRAFLIEQRIRELKYSSLGDSSTTEPL